MLNRPTDGYRIQNEDRTTIVALMRAGEPMASGVHDVLPTARFVHAHETTDLKEHHVKGQLTVVLVDAVINSGKTVIEFCQHVRKLHSTIQVVLLTGVVQDQFLQPEKLSEQLGKLCVTNLVMLRKSETKFVGSGGTDTGNRSFNATYRA